LILVDEAAEFRNNSQQRNSSSQSDFPILKDPPEPNKPLLGCDKASHDYQAWSCVESSSRGGVLAFNMK
jgi:hypothetical protein